VTDPQQRVARHCREIASSAVIQHSSAQRCRRAAMSEGAAPDHSRCAVIAPTTPVPVKSLPSTLTWSTLPAADQVRTYSPPLHVHLPGSLFFDAFKPDPSALKITTSPFWKAVNQRQVPTIVLHDRSVALRGSDRVVTRFLSVCDRPSSPPDADLSVLPSVPPVDPA
jgi:hypothetical protein